MLDLEVSVLSELLTMNETKKVSVGRVESFKTSLAIQKQKLLRQTQIHNQFEKTKVDKDLKKKEEEEKSAKGLIFGALRKLSGTSRKNSKTEQRKEIPTEKTPPKTPPTTPIPNRDPEPLQPPKEKTIPQPCTCQEEPSRKTPVPSDSPLLKKIQQDPIIKRIRSFNKSLKKAHSFRISREKSVEPNKEVEEPVSGQEVTFRIKKSTLGRIGWKIMPEDDSMNLKMNQDILNQVLDRIRTMQYSGEVVPDRMTVKLK